MQLLLIEVKKHSSIAEGCADRYEYLFKGENTYLSLTMDSKVDGWDTGEQYDVCVGRSGDAG